MRNHSKRGGRSPPRDDYWDIKAKPLEFNGNQNPDEYLEWVQALDRIFEARLLALSSQGMPLYGLKIVRRKGLEMAREG